jgi:arylsulfatase A
MPSNSVKQRNGNRLALLACLGIVFSIPSWAPAAPPNVILIVADDLGYGDLGCYGGRTPTPHLDRMAAEGIRFTDFHSNGPMCSPTRAALLTGLYQQRFGPEFESALGPEPGLGLPLNAITIAELLKPAGYATGMFGKWHLGNGPPTMPTRQGFDHFRGLLTGDGDFHTRVNRNGGEDWWNGETIEMEPGYTTDLITRHSIDFIERHRDQPFLLYIPHLAIHFPWQGPNDPAHRAVGHDYTDDKWGLIPDRSNVAPHVSSMIQSLDTSVGAILASLKKLELERDTVVFFMSDNGGYLDYSGGFENISSNGPLRGQKTQVYEGGHRVPAIAWWPERIKPHVSDELILTFDLLPTILHLAGLPKHASDGINLEGLLLRGDPLPERTVFWRIGGSKAVRSGPWKLVVNSRDNSTELFNLEQDIGESRDLAGQHPQVVQELLDELRRWEDSVTGDSVAED